MTGRSPLVPRGDGRATVARPISRGALGRAAVVAVLVLAGPTAGDKSA